jgi:hypothetical protein
LDHRNQLRRLVAHGRIQQAGKKGQVIGLRMCYEVGSQVARGLGLGRAFRTFAASSYTRHHSQQEDQFYT